MSQTDIDQLSRWRTLGARNSEQVVKLATRVVAAGGLGDNEWALREQLAIAALDLGMVKLATDQLDALQKRFPGSPRVKLLRGLRFEALGNIEGAKIIYGELLADDECNVSAHQRLIALAQSSPQQVITQLLAYLDTFYSDPQGWSLLAELYADQGLYAQSLTALGHLSLLQSWNSMAVIRAGETAYTMGDYQLALKYFLRATEMEALPSGPSLNQSSRSWWGVKLATRQLLDTPRRDSSVPNDMMTTVVQLEKLAELATERLLSIGGEGMALRRKLLARG